LRNRLYYYVVYLARKKTVTGIQIIIKRYDHGKRGRGGWAMKNGKKIDGALFSTSLSNPQENGEDK